MASLDIKAQAVFPPAAVAVAAAEGAGIILVEGSADAVAKLGVVAHLGINLTLVAECLANVNTHAEDSAVQMVTCYVHAIGGGEGFIVQASQRKLGRWVLQRDHGCFPGGSHIPHLPAGRGFWRCH
mgnify:CR=1 FL=1